MAPLRLWRATTASIKHTLPKAALAIFLVGSPLLAQTDTTAAGSDYGFLSILPPLIAIALALLFRQVIIALLAGIWLGATFLYFGNPALGLMRTLDTYLIQALADADHVAIVLFTLILGGMVGLISRSGATRGLVASLIHRARTPRSAQLLTWMGGLIIFFDDYASCLLVGHGMRPLCDRHRVSREKLSYIVDSTGAPVTSMFIISTWIGFEIGLIGDAYHSMGFEVNSYWIFIQSIPYRFYTIFALILVFLVAWFSRDIGGMWKAEMRARTTGKLVRPGGVPLSGVDQMDGGRSQETTAPAYYAWLPIAVVILATLIGLYLDGRANISSSTPTLAQIIGHANSFHVLMWAAFCGAVVAGVLPLLGKRMKLQAVLDAFIAGVQSMNIAIVILILAWALGQICKDMHTAQTVIDWSRPILSPHLLPAAIFALAALISFATGTSWGTMAILFPIAIPAAQTMAPSATYAGVFSPNMIHLGTVGAVLAGAVFGDHCSPISDTTILSSMASGSDHIDHVKTQIPYAMAAALIALFVGYLPSGWGISPWICLGAGILFLILWLLIFGKKVHEDGRNA
jgi:Na+/H+ antiporter NhaC